MIMVYEIEYMIYMSIKSIKPVFSQKGPFRVH